MKKRKTWTSPLATRADTSVQEMMEEDIVNEFECDASSTLSKEGRTTVGKLVKEMGPLCFIYNTDFKNLVQEHVVAVREDLTG